VRACVPFVFDLTQKLESLCCGRVLQGFFRMYSGRENAYEGEESEGHHHHHHHHHEREESEEYQRQPPYGSELEPRRGYAQEELVAPAPYGYRPPVHEYGGGPYEEGGPYGTVLHQNSPYAHAPPPPAPAPVHRGGEEQQRHHRVDIPGRLVRIFCKANPNFHVSVRPGKGVVMAPFNPHDEYQVWVKEESMGTRVKDSTGSPAFALVNKATGQALRHAPADLEQVLLADFQLGVQDESLLWSQSEDMGEGYHCIRMVNKITSNLDALQGDKKSGGVKDGTPVILFAWKKQENQVWKIIPA
jgi:hypothetical protein